MFPVGQIVNDLMQAGLYLGPVTVPNRFDQQIPETLLAEELAKNIENSPSERFALQFDFFEQALIDITLASLFGQ